MLTIEGKILIVLTSASLAVSPRFAESTTSAQEQSPLQSPAAPLPQLFADSWLETTPYGTGQLGQEAGGDSDSGVEEERAKTQLGKPLKSPQRSLLYSAILPGAGEFYAGARKRAALFFGLEAVAWGLYLSWNGKGDDIEVDFRRDADEQWEALNYVNWRGSTISRNSSITHALPCSSYVVTVDNVTDCPSSDKQQYYELIGKYDQFISGWTDVTDGTNRVQPTEIDSAENFRSELRLAYEDKRNESNKNLKRATNVAGLILVNHVLSAIDAARAARATAQGADAATLQRRTRLAFVRGGSSGKTPILLAYKPFF